MMLNLSNVIKILMTYLKLSEAISYSNLVFLGVYQYSMSYSSIYDRCHQKLSNHNNFIIFGCQCVCHYNVTTLQPQPLTPY